MPTFDEMFEDFANCMDYLFSNPTGKTCMSCADNVVLSATVDKLTPNYPNVQLTCNGKVIQHYNTWSGYEFSRKVYDKIRRAMK